MKETYTNMFGKYPPGTFNGGLAQKTRADIRVAAAEAAQKAKNIFKRLAKEQ